MSTAQPTRSISSRPRVLVVDDERPFADLLALILELSGFSARAVYSGSVAVDIARTLAPDVVVSDIQMPGMNGVRTAVAIKKLYPRCGVILLSGSEPGAVAESFVAPKGESYKFDFMRKPVSPAEVIGKITDLLRQNGDLLKRNAVLNVRRGGRNRQRRRKAA